MLSRVILHIFKLNDTFQTGDDTVIDLLVPRVTPARVNGGGGGRSELVITWEVNLYSVWIH